MSWNFRRGPRILRDPNYINDVRKPSTVLDTTADSIRTKTKRPHVTYIGRNKIVKTDTDLEKANEALDPASLAMIGGSVAAGAAVGSLVNRIRRALKKKPNSVNKVKKDKPLGPEYAHEKERYYNMGAEHARNGLPARPPSTAHPELKNHYYAGHEENS